MAKEVDVGQGDSEGMIGLLLIGLEWRYHTARQ